MKLTEMLAAASAALCVLVGASSALATEVNISASSSAGTDVLLGVGTYDVTEIAGEYVSANTWEGDGGAGGTVEWHIGHTKELNCPTSSTCEYGFRPTFDITIDGVATTYGLPGAKSSDPPTFETAAGALAAFQAYEAANPITFTLTSPTLVDFSIPGISYADNCSGISLSVVSTVVSCTPEPATWMLTVAAIGGVGIMLRRSKKSRFDSLDEIAAV